MKQILLIHGGDSYSSYDAYLQDLKSMQLDYARLLPQKKWKQTLSEELPGYDILMPTFPNGYNANYDEWVIYFEKIIPFLTKDAQIIGHSLGAMFLANYLHSHILPVKVRRIILLAGQYGERVGDDMGSFVVKSATGLDINSHEIHLFFSSDDPVIDFASLARFETDIPSAITHKFTDRGHFISETFPELIELLKQK